MPKPKIQAKTRPNTLFLIEIKEYYKLIIIKKT